MGILGVTILDQARKILELHLPRVGNGFLTHLKGFAHRVLDTDHIQSVVVLDHDEHDNHGISGEFAAFAF